MHPTHALTVLVDLDEGADRIEFGRAVCLAIATKGSVESRRSRIVGGRDGCASAPSRWASIASPPLQGLPVYERIDFEKV